MILIQGKTAPRMSLSMPAVGWLLQQRTSDYFAKNVNDYKKWAHHDSNPKYSSGSFPLLQSSTHVLIPSVRLGVLNSINHKNHVILYDKTGYVLSAFEKGDAVTDVPFVSSCLDEKLSEGMEVFNVVLSHKPSSLPSLIVSEPFIYSQDTVKDSVSAFVKKYFPHLHLIN